MSRLSYAKLAFENLRKNKSLYLPYILTAVGMGAMFYIMQAITRDEGVDKMYGGSELRLILQLGTVVIAIFACIFLFYTNSFLMKRRKKEFGLFHILGMEKRHIAKMMFWETVIVGAISILGGLAAGIILNKMVVLLLLRITHLEVPFGFSILGKALRDTAILFLAIFLVTLLYNFYQIQKSKPVELLQSASQGEAEPKARWILAGIGVLALAAGYYIAITTTDPLGAIMLFFVAVILVMIGTYCLFVAGSIAVLKMLRKNKKYYYQTAHFASVSGMIYRMKQNAVGLANVCILSTTVLVMISGTVSLYAGMTNVVERQFPREISVTANEMSETGKADLLKMAEETAVEQNVQLEGLSTFETLPMMVWKDGEVLQLGNEAMYKGEVSFFTFITLEDYKKLGGKAEALEENEILVHVLHGDEGEKQYNLQGKNLHIMKYLKECPKELLADEAAMVGDVYYVVVKDMSVLEEIDTIQRQVYQSMSSQKEYEVMFDVSGEVEKEKAYVQGLNKKITSYRETVLRDGTEAWIREADSQAERGEELYVFYGGFLFLGIFLGFVFLLANVLIIYYKQISEGYEDKGRYEIMQKVGMSHKEVKASIRSQILKIFFLPLVTACIHLAAAFPLMNRLLALFGMMDTVKFAICTLITVAVFAVIYGIVYMLTARTYYKIVES